MGKDDSGAKVPPAGQNLGQGRTDIESARPNVLQELRASVKDSETNARLGLGELYLPIDGFRPEIQEILNTVAWDYDAHRDKCVMAAIESVAMVTGNKVSATFNKKWTNNAMLMGLVVDDSGGVKSAINEYFMTPVEDINAKAKKAYNKAIKEYNNLTYEQQKDEEKPYPDLHVTNNYTPERLAQLDNTSTIGVSFYRDEMSGYYRGIGKYSSSGKSDAIEQQLTLGDGRIEANDRVSDGEELTVTKKTAFSMYGTIQPDTFDDFFIPLIQSKNGYFNRFHFVFPEPRKQRHIDLFDKVKTDPKVWETFIYDLYQNIPPHTVYTFEEAANYRFANYVNEHVIDVTNQDLYSKDFFTSYLRRNTRGVLRLAIIIHVMNDWKSPVITEREMKMAIEMQQTFNKYAQKLLNRIPSSSRTKQNADSPAEAIKMMYRLNMAKGNPASAVNQSDLAKMLGVSQAYVNKVKATMIKDGDLSDDDSRESAVTATEQTPIEVTQQSQDPAEVQESGSTDSAEGDGETTGKDNAVIPAEEGTLESQDSPTPSVPPKIRSGDDDGGNVHVSPDEDSGGSTS